MLKEVIQLSKEIHEKNTKLKDLKHELIGTSVKVLNKDGSTTDAFIASMNHNAIDNAVKIIPVRKCSKKMTYPSSHIHFSKTEYEKFKSHDIFGYVMLTDLVME